MWPQAMAAPDAMHRTDADCADRGDGRRRPVRDFTRRLAQRQRHHALSDRVAERRDARRARLVDLRWPRNFGQGDKLFPLE